MNKGSPQFCRMVYAFPYIIYQRFLKPYLSEIGHVVARHTAERISSQAVMMALVIALQALGIDYGLSSLLRTFLLELPNSRTQEFEGAPICLNLRISLAD